MYTLIAQNKQGATVEFSAERYYQVIAYFCDEYQTKGWKITVYKNGELHKELKVTYR